MISSRAASAIAHAVSMLSWAAWFSIAASSSGLIVSNSTTEGAIQLVSCCRAKRPSRVPISSRPGPTTFEPRSPGLIVERVPCGAVGVDHFGCVRRVLR
jgi:hypothetical protein